MTDIATNEQARLTAVRRYDILDTPPDGTFDRITALAARICDVPIAIVSIVDADRIWFKSHYGLEAKQIDREPGLCASAIMKDGPHILPDARRDPHAMTNPLVAGEFGLRFYAGVPLTTNDGHNLGTLCVIDKEPRDLTPHQLETLKDLAATVMDSLELRRSAIMAHSMNEAVIHEMSHRVANSLALVSSLLTMQGRGEPPDVAERFNAAAGRVAAVGRIHRKLSHTDRDDKVDFRPYLEGLCREIAESILPEEQIARVRVDAEEAELKSNCATALGLVVNELLTNAVKYAGAGADIIVTFRKVDGGFRLAVTDNGPGMPDGFDHAASERLGMRVIRALVQQIGGSVQFSRNAGGIGTAVIVTFA